MTLEAVETPTIDGGVPLPPVPKPLTDTGLRDQFAELRRALMASIDTQSERITSDVRMLIQDAQLGANNGAGASRESRAGWVVAVIALLVALGSAGLWWREAALRQDLVAQLAELKSNATPPVPAVAATAVLPGGASVAAPAAENGSEGDAATAAPAAAGSTGAATPANGADNRPVVTPVPYGGDALGGPRLEWMRQAFTRLAARHYAGMVEVRTFPGRFCLVGNASEGYSLAPDEMAFSRCNAVSNPHDDAADPAQRESLAFANLVGEFRNATQGALDIRLNPGDASSVAVAYPQVGGALTAGEWNRAAAANNRVEIRLK